MNECLKKQEPTKTIEVFNEADIGASVSRQLMPVKETIKHVDIAIDQINAYQYYKTKLSLKRVEDDLLLNTLLLYEPVAMPKNQNL